MFNAEAGAPGGIGLPFETKLQAVNRLQEGLCFAEGRSYTRDTYKAMADEFAAKWLVGRPATAFHDAPTSTRGDAVDARRIDSLPVVCAGIQLSSGSFMAVPRTVSTG